MISLPLQLTKVTRSSSVIRIAGAASDNRVDLYRTRFDRRLYQSFIDRRPEFEPYLSVAHFHTPVGSIEREYIDGRYFKITGEIPLDTPMGDALARSLQDDDVRARTGFSVGFDDEDYYFDDTAGGLQTYVGGLLVHVAFTTIPANPRSRITSIEMSRAKSQYDDAALLVGPVYAAYLAERDKRRKLKSVFGASDTARSASVSYRIESVPYAFR